MFQLEHLDEVYFNKRVIKEKFLSAPEPFDNTRIMRRSRGVVQKRAVHQSVSGQKIEVVLPNVFRTHHSLGDWLMCPASVSRYHTQSTSSSSGRDKAFIEPRHLQDS